MGRIAVTPRASKPGKPYESFPLYAHANGRWAKRIRGKIHYFGKWDDWQGALERFQDQRDDLMAGRVPRTPKDGLNVRQLVNHFLTRKRMQLDAGEITARTFADYYATAGRLVKAFGRGRLVDDLNAEDFARVRAGMTKRWGPVTVAGEITRARVIFNFAYQNQLIDRPVRYGSAFQKPPKRVLRQAQHASGSRMFEAEEVRRLVDGAPHPLGAMILLGVNCGFGNADVGTLPSAAVDLAAGWINYPRPKTGVERRCPLWPETIRALEDVLANRPAAKNLAHADLLFLTRCRGAWWTDNKADPISREFKKLTRGLGLYKPRRGFYSLRHVFATVAGGCKDQVAVNAIMGHADPSMAAVYRERIDDDRLRAVVEHVHDWLFGEQIGDKKETESGLRIYKQA